MLQYHHEKLLIFVNKHNMYKTLKTLFIGLLVSIMIPSPLLALTSQQRAFLDATRSLQKSYTLISGDRQQENTASRQEVEDMIRSVLAQLQSTISEDDLLQFGSTLPIAGSTYTLAGSGVTGSATSITLASLTIPQTGQKIVDSDLSDTFYLTLEPGSRTKQEIASCTTVTQNGNGTATLSGCTRGLSPISPYTASSTLQFAHAGGSQVIFSDPPQLFNLYTAKDNLETITNTWTFTSSTGPFVRVYFGNNKTYGFWHNTTTGQIGYTSSTSDFVFNANGTTFSTVLPLQLIGGELKLATSTYDLELRDNLLGLTTSTVAGGTASGSALDDLWNSRFNATTTHPGSFTFGGNVTSTGHIAATEILQNNVSLLTLANGSNADSLHVHSNYNQLLTVTSSDYIYSNSASELTLYTTTLTGGSIDSNDVITFDVDFYNLDVDTVDNPQIDLRYGGSTILSLVVDNTDGSIDLTNGVGRAKLTMYNNSATNAQKTFGWFQASQTHFDASGASVGSGSVYATSSAAIDSTSNQTLSLIFKCTSANTACGFDGISVKANLERN